MNKQPVRYAYLALMALIMSLLPLSSAQATEPMNSQEAWFVNQVNAHRANAGLPPMRAVADLADAARDQSRIMGETNHLHHSVNLGSRVGGWLRIAENVGFGMSIESIDNALMNSTGHRANMLGPTTQIGVGTVTVNGRIWMTQIFRTPDASKINEPGPGTAAPLPPAGGNTEEAACPVERVQWFKYSDVDPSSSHRAAVDCASWWGLIQGKSGSSFAPAEGLTRGQSASILARLLQRAGKAPTHAPDAFTDDNGNVHEANINLLAAAGIANGSNGAFKPNQALTRAQGAAMLVRTVEAIQGPLPAAENTFSDMQGHVLGPEVAKAAANGIVGGYSSTVFGGNDPLRRDQGGSLITRSVQLLVKNGRLTP